MTVAKNSNRPNESECNDIDRACIPHLTIMKSTDKGINDINYTTHLIFPAAAS